MVVHELHGFLFRFGLLLKQAFDRSVGIAVTPPGDLACLIDLIGIELAAEAEQPLNRAAGFDPTSFHCCFGPTNRRRS